MSAENTSSQCPEEGNATLVYRLIAPERDAYKVYHVNGVFLGEIINADGLWTWFADIGRHGGFPAHILREIADKMEELNEELHG